MAYDTIMVFPDQFKKHILPEQIHILNVSFMVRTAPGVRRDRRQHCLHLKLLGEDPASWRPWATISPLPMRLESCTCRRAT